MTVTNLIGRQARGHYKSARELYVTIVSEIVAVTSDSGGELFLWVLDEDGTPRRLVDGLSVPTVLGEV